MPRVKLRSPRNKLIFYEKVYKQEKSDIDKAILTLENGHKKDLLEKYKNYIKCQA